ncbi:4819_t:CDS:1, partial [Acaulospora morrowiae]
MFDRVEYAPSIASLNESENFEYQQTEDFNTFNDCQYVEKDDKRTINLNNYYASYSDSDRSSVMPEIDPVDVFMNKIYAFVRRFKRNVLWLGENFLANSLVRGTPFSTSDGVLSDVTVEIKPTNMQIPNEVALKGRILF